MVARSRAYDCDADRYVRWRKGKYQARPVDLGVRYNLGLFPTRELARQAVLEFWRGKRPEKPRFVRRAEAADGSDAWEVWIHDRGSWVRSGPYPTPGAAAAARDGWLRERFGDGWEARLWESTRRPAKRRRPKLAAIARAIRDRPGISDDAVAELVARRTGVRPRPASVAAARRWLAAYDLFSGVPA